MLAHLPTAGALSWLLLLLTASAVASVCVGLPPGAQLLLLLLLSSLLVVVSRGLPASRCFRLRCCCCLQVFDDYEWRKERWKWSKPYAGVVWLSPFFPEPKHRCGSMRHRRPPLPG